MERAGFGFAAEDAGAVVAAMEDGVAQKQEKAGRCLWYYYKTWLTEPVPYQ